MKEVSHGRSEPAGLCELREQVEGICVWGKGGWGEAQVYSRDSTPESKGWILPLKDFKGGNFRRGLRGGSQ